MRHGKVWRTRHKFGGGLPLLPDTFHLSFPGPVGRHCRAVFAPAALSADRASRTHLVCCLRNRHHRGDSWSADRRLDGSRKGSAIRDSSAGRRTQTQKIRRRFRKITSYLTIANCSHALAIIKTLIPLALIRFPVAQASACVPLFGARRLDSRRCGLRRILDRKVHTSNPDASLGVAAIHKKC